MWTNENFCSARASMTISLRIRHLHSPTKNQSRNTAFIFQLLWCVKLLVLRILYICPLTRNKADRNSMHRILSRGRKLDGAAIRLSIKHWQTERKRERERQTDRQRRALTRKTQSSSEDLLRCARRRAEPHAAIDAVVSDVYVIDD